MERDVLGAGVVLQLSPIPGGDDCSTFIAGRDFPP
jgi:hypothetical protein